MTHTYEVTGMTCTTCESKVKSELLKLPDVEEVDISKERNEAVIKMGRHISFQALQNAIAKAGTKYAITETGNHAIEMNTDEKAKTWFQTYKPILLIFFYITTVGLFLSIRNGNFFEMAFMNVFMAGFFLTFSFFKMLDIRGFAQSYKMYDIVAKYIPAWGYLYAFVELFLGISYATGFYPFAINIITLVVMSVSIIGVLQSVLNKRKIQCACLGAVFNLPMSTVTIIEDALMITMSLAMLLIMY